MQKIYNVFITVSNQVEIPNVKVKILGTLTAKKAEEPVLYN
jgi:hypothetical protein